MFCASSTVACNNQSISLQATVCSPTANPSVIWLLVLQDEKQGKRKGHDSPEGRRHKRPYHGPPHGVDWGHHPAGPPAYDSPQRMQRAYLPPRAVGASPLGRPPGKSSKSLGSPHKVLQYAYTPNNALRGNLHTSSSNTGSCGAL